MTSPAIVPHTAPAVTPRPLPSEADRAWLHLVQAGTCVYLAAVLTFAAALIGATR